MDIHTTMEHNETAYGWNLRGFRAFMPHAFGSDPKKMEDFYNQIYVYGPDPRFPVTVAMLAGAAAYKAVREHEVLFKPNRFTQHDEAVNKIRQMAAAEAESLLQRFPLDRTEMSNPAIDPAIVLLSAEAGAHRLYDHEHFF